MKNIPWFLVIIFIFIMIRTCRSIFIIFFTFIITLSFVRKPIFADSAKKDQISINISNSTTRHPLRVLKNFDRLHFEEMYMLVLQYSQPDEIFRLNGKRNFEIISWFTFSNNEFSKYNQTFIGISQDVIFNISKNIYFGGGLGMYIKDKKTDRIGSQFTFGQSYFIGYNIKNTVELELIVRHFSNGGLTEINHGQNFIGLKINYNLGGY